MCCLYIAVAIGALRAQRAAAQLDQARTAAAITFSVIPTNPSCGYNNGSILVTASGGTPPYKFAVNGNSQNNGYFPSLNASGSGHYNIQVTDAAGASATDQVILTDALPPPSITIAASVFPTDCTSKDGVITVTGSGGSLPYQYSIDGINFSPSNTFTGLSRGTYFFFVKDANGCIQQRGFGFLGEFECKNPCGLVCNGEGGLTSCNNDGSIDIVAFGGVEPYSYSVDGVNFQGSIYAHQSMSFSSLAAGLYTLYVKDAAGTLVIAGYQLIQSCAVKVVFVGVDASCGASDGAVTVHASNGSPPYTFSIDGINYQTDSLFTGLSTGAYSVTVKDAAGTTSSRQVTVFDKCPAITATATDETCGTSNGSIAVAGTKGELPYSFSIDGSHFQASPIFSGLPAGNYAVTLRDANGFTVSSNVKINNNCLLLGLSATNASCGRNNGSIQASGSGGMMPYRYSIDAIHFQGSGYFNGLAPGTYNVSVQDGAGLTTASSVLIADLPAAVIHPVIVPASCNNTGGSISIAREGGIAPFLYSISNGLNQSPDSVFTGLDSSAYIVWVRDNNGCISTDSVYLAALPTPEVFLGNDTVLCNGTSLLLKAPVANAYSFIWQDNSTAGSFKVTSGGRYWLKVSNTSGCSAADTVNIQFRPLPLFSLGNDTALCEGTVYRLQPALPHGSYLWSTGSLGDYITAGSEGLYWLAVSDSGCTATDSVHISFKTIPAVNLGRDTILCSGQSLLLDASIPAASYLWSDGSTANTYTVSKAGVYSVNVSANGCSASGKITVMYNSKPPVAFAGDTSACNFQVVSLDASYPGSSYLWQDGSTTPRYTATQAGLYTVRVTNSCGVTQDSIHVQLENCSCGVHVPNVFTPNADGRNDVFHPFFKCPLSGYRFDIYNRWGQLVFHSSDAATGWDGRYKGQDQPEGGYLWQIKYKDALTEKTMTKSGTLVLIR